MNRRGLLKTIGQAAIGLVAVPFALKAAEPPADPIVTSMSFNDGQVTKYVVTTPNSPQATVHGPYDEEYIIEIFANNYRGNGRIRQIIQQDREWGL
jgi:hypothetical protein